MAMLSGLAIRCLCMKRAYCAAFHIPVFWIPAIHAGMTAIKT
ncbi:hypothetical protein [Methyloglobulus sp.]